MSTSEPNTTVNDQQQIQLPAGWTAGPARETTSTNAAGQLTQGVLVPLSSSAGTTASVFIPDLTLQQGAQAVAALINAKIASISVIPGQVA